MKPTYCITMHLHAPIPEGTDLEDPMSLAASMLQAAFAVTDMIEGREIAGLNFDYVHPVEMVCVDRPLDDEEGPPRRPGPQELQL